MKTIELQCSEIVQRTLFLREYHQSGCDRGFEL